MIRSTNKDKIAVCCSRARQMFISQLTRPCITWRRIQIKKKITLVISTVVLFFVYWKFGTFNENIEGNPLRYASHELDSKYFLEPLVTEDFPTVIGQAPKIPHIIHQTYKNEFIPNKYIPFIKSFVKYNANWTYMFWTDASARKFISDRYPDFLPVWDNYAEPINRADALRYFVLYEYGGVYADLDFECLRPLDRVTMKYTAVFPLEPFEHAVFRLRIPFCVNNAIMMAQPKHSFLRHIVYTISSFRPMKGTLDVAGPIFVTTQYMLYNNFSVGEFYKVAEDHQGSSPYHYKGRLHETDPRAVYVPNTHYFMNTLAENWFSKSYWHYRRVCSNLDPTSGTLERKACNEFKAREDRSEHDHFRFTYTRHHWFFTHNTLNFLPDVTRYTNIQKIVPHLVLYT
ncbi:uncharacterized protein LOC127872707 [Dreissena polymorpha]|uniref:Uncharacterized protein n=1 Tax=Dreissena polymorpha TaxID=45954 RepID=A0A9D4KS30_DREPO|nr:uncharacterized protein LOC127872707 [Dreissena polymorpha]KAH3844091.1 hypothetical protein DPMN_086342 [Dreissena polymorpha]